MLSTSRRIISDRFSSMMAGGSPTKSRQRATKSACGISARTSKVGGLVSSGIPALLFGALIRSNSGFRFAAHAEKVNSPLGESDIRSGRHTRPVSGLPASEPEASSRISTAHSRVIGLPPPHSFISIVAWLNFRRVAQLHPHEGGSSLDPALLCVAGGSAHLFLPNVHPRQAEENASLEERQATCSKALDWSSGSLAYSRSRPNMWNLCGVLPSSGGQSACQACRNLMRASYRCRMRHLSGSSSRLR